MDCNLLKPTLFDATYMYMGFGYSCELDKDESIVVISGMMMIGYIKGFFCTIDSNN